MAIRAVIQSEESESCNGEESVNSSVNDQKEDEARKNPQSEDIQIDFDDIAKGISNLIYRNPSIPCKQDSLEISKQFSIHRINTDGNVPEVSQESEQDTNTHDTFIVEPELIENCRE